MVSGEGHGLLRYSAPSGGFTSGERPGEVCLGSLGHRGDERDEPGG